MAEIRQKKRSEDKGIEGYMESGSRFLVRAVSNKQGVSIAGMKEKEQ
jgi:hypothetical protein